MPEPDRRSWLARHWPWAIAGGCLVLLMLAAALAGGVFFAVMAGVKSTDAYRGAVERATSSPAVHAALGEPVEPGWLVSGNVSVNGSSGDADLSVPLSGPRGKGTLYATAHKRAGRWEFQVLEVAVEGRQDRIELLSR
jgi:predicted anti-sigma-YlaC factor YlaD